MRQKQKEARESRNEDRHADDAGKAVSSRGSVFGSASSGGARAALSGNSANYAGEIYGVIRSALAGFPGQGSAVLGFSVSARGNVSCSVSASSGDADFSGLCGRLRSISLPPPPGGHFNGRLPIRLHRE